MPQFIVSHILHGALYIASKIKADDGEAAVEQLRAGADPANIGEVFIADKNPLDDYELTPAIESVPQFRLNQLFVLTIEHRHGTDSWVHRTEAGARSSLEEWCREWWDKECRGRWKFPSDDSDAVWGDPPEGSEIIDTYFALVDDECWALKPCEVMP